MPGRIRGIDCGRSRFGSCIPKKPLRRGRKDYDGLVRLDSWYHARLQSTYSTNFDLVRPCDANSVSSFSVPEPLEPYLKLILPIVGLYILHGMRQVIRACFRGQLGHLRCRVFVLGLGQKLEEKKHGSGGSK